MPGKPLPVVVEVAKGKAFASALPWPGWCRAGRTEEAALAALADYAPRYAAVAAPAGIAFTARRRRTLDVVRTAARGRHHRLRRAVDHRRGGAGRLTAAPGRPAGRPGRAAWAVLDDVAA